MFQILMTGLKTTLKNWAIFLLFISTCSTAIFEKNVYSVFMSLLDWVLRLFCNEVRSSTIRDEMKGTDYNRKAGWKRRIEVLIRYTLPRYQKV